MRCTGTMIYLLIPAALLLLIVGSLTDHGSDVSAPVHVASVPTFGRRQEASPEPSSPSTGLLTVAIATYRRADRLKTILPEYLASPIVAKVVISDDFGSEDAAVLRTWLSNMSVAHSERVELLDPPPRRLSAMRNKIRAARAAARFSEWICLMDSDNTATHHRYFEPLVTAWLAARNGVPPRGTAAELRIHSASLYYISRRPSWMSSVFCRLASGVLPTNFCAPPLEAADFRALLSNNGSTVTRSNYGRVMALPQGPSLMNDGNYVFHRRILDVWEPLAAGNVEPPGVDALFMNWHAIRQGFSLYLVPGMEYLHPASDDSFYKSHGGEAATAFTAQHGLSVMD